jgi:DNA-binding transcriptional MerR regulator
MNSPLDIAEVCRRTGLTSRTLRFYEARGLLAPLRTNSGRRLYGAGELARLNQITVLKRAGFSLTQIDGLLAGRAPDLAALIAAQLGALAADRRALEEAERTLRLAQAALARGEPLDTDILCNLIKEGDRSMADPQWKGVLDRYYSPEEQAHWAAKKAEFAASQPGFDPQAYTQGWRDLDARIAAALPLDPQSPQAQAFVVEWNAMIAPFMAIADDEMKQGAQRLWDDMSNWSGEVSSPISPAVWTFIKAAMTARDPAARAGRD